MTFPNTSKLIVNNLDQIIQAFNRLKNEINTFINAINNESQLQSIPLYNINIVAGNNQIAHTLEKPLLGWTLIDVQTASPKLIRYAPSTNTTLYLHSDVACTISLLVY